MNHFHALVASLVVWLEENDERGDVPGWVLVTLMTAGLVIAIWAIAGDALARVFNTAIDRVLSA
ncbi:MAG: hypothetical protein EOL91_03830 [Actinobacteria bacterium]|jgi:hypothetical protein|nr:hypothetical protein [Actinomycetota bacterium]